MKTFWHDINYLMAIRIAVLGMLFAVGYSAIDCVRRLPFVH